MWKIKREMEAFIDNVLPYYGGKRHWKCGKQLKLDTKYSFGVCVCGKMSFRRLVFELDGNEVSVGEGCCKERFYDILDERYVSEVKYGLKKGWIILGEPSEKLISNWC